MNEKKLTDEVVVKALEHCSHNRSCEYCYHNDERGSGEIVCRSRLMGKSLDLIHRQQKENEELITAIKQAEQQAVKDTAKEICDLILEHWEKKQFVECDWGLVALSEKYGVEGE